MIGSRPRPASSLLAAALVLLVASSCGDNPKVELRSHTNGEFVTTATGLVTISGVTWSPDKFVSVEVNGIPLPLVHDWSVDVPVSTAAVFNRITVTATRPTGLVKQDTLVLVVADGVTSDFTDDGDPSLDGVALRVGDTGLDQVAPVVQSLSSGALDIETLITAQNPIATGNFSGLVSYTANVVEVGFGGFGMSLDTGVGGLDTDIQIDDFFLEVDLDLDWLGSCTMEIQTSQANLTGSFDLAPMSGDPTSVDVNLITPVGVALAGFTSQFVSGVCNDPLIGDIINLIIGQGDIQQLMQDGFSDNLGDPDGSGPLDSVLASAIQDALAGVSIAGPVGEAVGGVLDAPISSITESADGLTIAADAAIYATMPDPLAPNLLGSYSVAGALPTFGATTPVGGLPYGMAFAISTSAMNQLLKTQIENGLLRDEITELFGFPLTAGTLAFFAPAFATIPAATPITIDILPTIAPIISGDPAPTGEFTELRIAALQVVLRETGIADAIVAVEVDLDVGLDLLFTEAGLEFSLGAPSAAGISATVIENTLDATVTELQDTIVNLFPLFVPQLEGAIEAFPIPSLLGLDLDPVEVALIGESHIGLYANLTQEPTIGYANVVYTDLSSGDFIQSGGCWLREWRHRVSGNVLGADLSANGRGMLGADAGCTTNDASSSATLSYQVTFDVVSVPGQIWGMQIDHSIQGALDRISDGYNDGFGFQDGGGTATIGSVTGTYTITGGIVIGDRTGTFDFTPSATHISDGWGGSSSNEDVGFSGTAGVLKNGANDVSVQLDFAVSLDAFSDSRTAFPTCNGDEMAIRIGKNDTIDNNFTAGSYPGMGSRNIADDGHKASVNLTSVPF